MAGLWAWWYLRYLTISCCYKYLWKLIIHVLVYIYYICNQFIQDRHLISPTLTRRSSKCIFINPAPVAAQSTCHIARYTISYLYVVILWKKSFLSSVSIARKVKSTILDLEKSRRVHHVTRSVVSLKSPLPSLLPLHHWRRLSLLTRFSLFFLVNACSMRTTLFTFTHAAPAGFRRLPNFPPSKHDNSAYAQPEYIRCVCTLQSQYNTYHGALTSFSRVILFPVLIPYRRG